MAVHITKYAYSPLGGTRLVNLKSSADNLTESLDKLLELGLGDLGVNVLDKDIGVLSSLLLDLGLSLSLSDVMTDKDLLVVEQHAVDGLDGSIGSLASRVVDETITT